MQDPSLNLASAMISPVALSFLIFISSFFFMLYYFLPVKFSSYHCPGRIFFHPPLPRRSAGFFPFQDLLRSGILSPHSPPSLSHSFPNETDIPGISALSGTLYTLSLILHSFLHFLFIFQPLSGIRAQKKQEGFSLSDVRLIHGPESFPQMIK